MRVYKIGDMFHTAFSLQINSAGMCKMWDSVQLILCVQLPALLLVVYL